MECAQEQENVIATQGGFKALQIHQQTSIYAIPVLLDSGVLIVQVSFLHLFRFS